MVAERTCGVVVLTVNIRTNGTTDGHLASTRQYRYPQAVGQCSLHQLIQCDTAVDINNRRLLVNGVDLVELLHVDDQTARVLGGVAVRAAHAAGNYTTALTISSKSGVDSTWDLAGAVRPQPVRVLASVCTAP